jgi:hypothetical protein
VVRPVRAHSSALGAGDEVGLREVDPVGFVHLDGAQQQRRIDADDRVERDQRPQRLSDLLSRRLVERLEDIRGLGRHEIGQQKVALGAQVGRAPFRHLRRIAGEGREIATTASV